LVARPSSRDTDFRQASPAINAPASPAGRLAAGQRRACLIAAGKRSVAGIDFSLQRGCVRGLFDRTTGLMTALMRFAPGAALPDREHVNIEQTYVS
jgi:hypothetical protein